MANTGALTNKPDETMCPICLERPLPKPRSRFCEPCARARRTWQLKVNNEKWKLRKSEDEAGHRLMYQGKPTEWARKNPIEAVKLAVKEGYSDAQLEALLRGLGLK